MLKQRPVCVYLSVFGVGWLRLCQRVHRTQETKAWLSCQNKDQDNLSPSYTDTKVRDRKSTRLNSSHVAISYAVFCLKKKKKKEQNVIQKTKAKHIEYIH